VNHPIKVWFNHPPLNHKVRQISLHPVAWSVAAMSGLWNERKEGERGKERSRKKKVSQTGAKDAVNVCS
jgi:hypothetical protein